MTFYPHVIETTGRSSKAYDLPTKLLSNRIVYLSGDITEELATSINMQLLWLDADNPNEDISLYISSNGGSVYHGMSIKNIMDRLNCKVNTIGIGICASMGAYLLASGTGTRKSLKDNRIMLHSVSGGTKSNFYDMEIDFKEVQYLQNKMMEHIADFTKGRTELEKVKKLCERDYYISSNEALELGLIDEVI